jgi:hypothetical protein
VIVAVSVVCCDLCGEDGKRRRRQSRVQVMMLLIEGLLLLYIRHASNRLKTFLCCSRPVHISSACPVYSQIVLMITLYRNCQQSSRTQLKPDETSVSGALQSEEREKWGTSPSFRRKDQRAIPQKRIQIMKRGPRSRGNGEAS